MIYIFLQICGAVTVSNHCHKGELTIPEGIREIKNEEYYGCTKFTGSLVIPDSVKYIGKYSFYNCYGFTGNLTLPKNIISIDDFAFYNCHGFTGNLFIPNTCKKTGIYLFFNCSSFSSLHLPNRLQIISSYSFCNCTGFKGALSIGILTTTIEKYAFSGCSGFNESLIFPSKLKTIEEGAFYKCSGFTGNIEFKNVKIIEKYAFYGCSNINSISLNTFTEKIGEKSFYNCKKLIKKINIPTNIKNIGEMAFDETNYEKFNSMNKKNEFELNKQKNQNKKLENYNNQNIKQTNYNNKNEKLKNLRYLNVKQTNLMIVIFVALIVSVAMCCSKTNDSLSQNEDTTEEAIDNSRDNEIVMITEQPEKEKEDVDVRIIKSKNDNVMFNSINDINEPKYNNANYIPKETEEKVETRPKTYLAPPSLHYPSTDDDGDNVIVELSSTDED